MNYCAAAAATTAILALSACGGGTAANAVVNGPATAPVAANLSIADEMGDAGGGNQAPAVADASAAAPAPVESFVDGSNDVSFESILNNLRVDRGLGEVSYDARLDAAAEKYAEEQAGISGLDHVGVNGSTVYDRIVAEGYDPIGWAENLAKGYQGQDAVLQAWIDSPGHNKNLNATLDDFALGVAGSGSNLSWVLLFATENPN